MEEYEKGSSKKWDGEAWTGFLWFRIGDRWWNVVDAVMNLQVP
jgi:hypothetical protein